MYIIYFIQYILHLLLFYSVVRVFRQDTHLGKFFFYETNFVRVDDPLHSL